MFYLHITVFVLLQKYSIPSQRKKIIVEVEEVLIRKEKYKLYENNLHDNFAHFHPPPSLQHNPCT